MSTAIPETMAAVLLTGQGGLDKLDYRTDVPVPRPGPGEVLIQVAAVGMNNTDINTRTGWYNADVTTGTTAAGGAAGFGADGMGDWSDGLTFPRIQGADCAGRIVAVGDGVDPARVGERVVCDPYIRDLDDLDGHETAGFFGSEHDGAFAQFARIVAGNAIAVPADLPLSDPQLATLPCSGGTAMNMLLMAGARAGDLALVTGASGGVGTFLVQLLKQLGAEVVAVASPSKWPPLRQMGADHLVDRSADPLRGAVRAATGGRPLSLVADVVGGPQFSDYLAVLKRGGRYVTAGAIAGPEVTLDLRTLYLKTLSFFGSTSYRRETFPKLVDSACAGGITPVVADTFPLDRIRDAQTLFLEKRHIGSYVLIPPPVEG